MKSKLFIMITTLCMLTGCASPAEQVVAIGISSTPEPAITPVAAAATVTPLPTPSEVTPSPSAAPTAAATPKATAAPEATATPVPESTNEAASEPAQTAASSDLGSGVLALVNAYRVAAGLNTLEYAASMQKAADTRAKECASSFSHTRPDGSKAYTALTERGLSFTAFGENIFAASGMSSVSAEYVTEQWMASQGHRENIMKDGYTHMCIGYAAQGDEIYVVQLFATGLS